eukprot:TRINITY_DN15320_c0_g1_i1.p1 TRINITY_DN15320_c0_g1~~TRINITY_DN15320_c0_g1_i1.p1  ORF type:complete len:180 (-),score=35.38 TRINITY_DN15320_c0_g1_i1:79-618(-)
MELSFLLNVIFLDGHNFGCNGGSNGGYRNGLPTVKFGSNKPKKMTTTTQPLKKRTTTISNRSKIEKYKHTTLKTTTVPYTSQARVQAKTTSTTRRTTTKRTAIVGVRVQFSFGRKQTTSSPRIVESRTEKKSFKTTTKNFEAKITNRPILTDKRIWTTRNKEPRAPKAKTLVDDRPVWG